MTEAHRFIWVQGNHDPAPPGGLGGEWVESFVAGPMVFRHQAAPAAEPGEVVGHHHPKAWCGREREPSAARALSPMGGG